MEFKTEYEFSLPRGYVDKEGNVHKDGVMRLATARDEIAPLNDMRVQRNRAYLIIVLLSRVVKSLGTLGEVNTTIVENLFAGLRKLWPSLPVSTRKRPRAFARS